VATIANNRKKAEIALSLTPTVQIQVVQTVLST